MDKLAEQYDGHGLMVIALNVESKESNYQKYIKSNPYAHLYWARDGSGEISRLYRVRALPTTYILDGESIIRYAQVGYGGQLEKVFAKEIESLLR